VKRDKNNIRIPVFKPLQKDPCDPSAVVTKTSFRKFTKKYFK